jgi:hypothetical protein
VPRPHEEERGAEEDEANRALFRRWLKQVLKGHPDHVSHDDNHAERKDDRCRDVGEHHEPALPKLVPMERGGAENDGEAGSRPHVEDFRSDHAGKWARPQNLNGDGDDGDEENGTPLEPFEAVQDGKIEFKGRRVHA